MSTDKKPTERQQRARTRNFAIGNVRAFRRQLTNICRDLNLDSFPELEQWLEKLEAEVIAITP